MFRMKGHAILVIALMSCGVVQCSELVQSSTLISEDSPEARHHASHQPRTDAAESRTTEADALEKRKVWSRWGKWGVCSVTCGEGCVARRRLCVAGRCAPGEREEQRRPCSKMPCFDFANATDEASR